MNASPVQTEILRQYQNAPWFFAVGAVLHERGFDIGKHSALLVGDDAVRFDFYASRRKRGALVTRKRAITIRYDRAADLYDVTSQEVAHDGVLVLDRKIEGVYADDLFNDPARFI